TSTGTLLPGESVTGTATYTITQADVDAGSVANSATGTGTPPSGPPLTPPGGTTVPLSPSPSIGLEKTGVVTSGSGVAGDTITYTFVATNTGNVTLTDVVITDPLTGLSALTFGSWPAASGVLLPGESVTATATYLVKQSDVD